MSCAQKDLDDLKKELDHVFSESALCQPRTDIPLGMIACALSGGVMGFGLGFAAGLWW